MTSGLWRQRLQIADMKKLRVADDPQRQALPRFNRTGIGRVTRVLGCPSGAERSSLERGDATGGGSMQ